MIRKLDRNISVVFTEDGFTYSNCVLVEDEVRLLIDTGAGSIMPQVNPEQIDIVINTHHHVDHVRGNNLCSKARILLHPLEHVCMQSMEEMTATTGWDQLMEGKTMPAPSDIGVIMEQLGGPWRVDGAIHDGDVIDCGQTEIIVLHTPGHSAGHCSFYFPDQEMVFLGDICLTKAGPWYGDDNASIDDFIHSIERIIALRPKLITASHINKIISGNITATLTEYRDRILKREQRILSYLQDHSSNIDQLANQHLIYRDHPTAFVLFWEKYMIKKHLERLMANGAVQPLGDGYYKGIKTG